MVLVDSHDFGEVMYTLTSLIVAAYNPTANTYGTPEMIADGQMLGVEPEADNDKLRGYGQNRRGLSVVIGAKVSFKAGGIDFSALSLMCNVVNTTTGASGSQVRRTPMVGGGNGLPYFGAIGVGAVDGGGVAVIGVPMIKLDTYPKYELNGETNKFILWETAGYAFIPSGLTYPYVLEEHETAATWVPPTTGSAFKTCMMGA